MIRKTRISTSIFIIMSVTAILGVIVAGTAIIIREKRVRKYCYSISLPDIHAVSYNSYYCLGVRNGNTIIISVPNSVLRKE